MASVSKSREVRPRNKILKFLPHNSLSCFEAKNTPHRHRVSRSKFDVKRRAEVADVRRRGACLRCRLLKRKCDGTDPCTNCLKLATDAPKIHEKRVLKFSYCIRTPMSAASIFEHALPPFWSYGCIIASAEHQVSAIKAHSVFPENRWTAVDIINDIVGWSGRGAPVLVWPPLSPSFFALLEPVTGSEYARHFQRLIYHENFTRACSNSLEGEEARRRLSEQAVAISGHQCLAYLDSRMNAKALAECGENDLQVIFILLICAISAISFSCPFTLCEVIPTHDGSIDEHQKLLDLMQEHICRTIGHFIVFIGSRIGVRILPEIQRLIVDASPAEWRVAANGTCSPSSVLLCVEGPPKYTFESLKHACKRE